jgi:hypothetical protein
MAQRSLDNLFHYKEQGAKSIPPTAGTDKSDSGIAILNILLALLTYGRAFLFSVPDALKQKNFGKNS